MSDDPIFTNWDDRPAVVWIAERVAVAVLEPGGTWVRVDAPDVVITGRVMSPAAAEAAFGPLPPLPSPDSVRASSLHAAVSAAS